MPWWNFRAYANYPHLFLLSSIARGMDHQRLGIFSSFFSTDLYLILNSIYDNNTIYENCNAVIFKSQYSTVLYILTRIIHYLRYSYHV
jgi:hypothetical protein